MTMLQIVLQQKNEAVVSQILFGNALESDKYRNNVFTSAALI